MDPDELCRCGHERKWHDACSICGCPWFISRTNDGALARWEFDKLVRSRADKRAARRAR